VSNGSFFRPHLTTFGSLPGSAALVLVGIVIGLIGEWLWGILFFALAVGSLGLWWWRRR
jgi:hypothetical protein